VSRVGDLHGQGLRARRLQQQGLHLGQGRPARPGADRQIIGALGDIHGDFAAARAIIVRHPDVPFWLCVGDIADEHGRYESLGAPVYWIHGNNDNFDAIAAGDLPADLHHIPNATPIDAGALRVAGLGGTFAPTWYETAASELPHPKKGSAKATEAPAARARRRSEAPRSGAAEREARGGGAPRAVKDDKRRHFVREEVEACKRLRDVDVFLTHEAAKPFRPFPGGRGPDAGKAQINEILAATQPRLHLFGHHHRFSEQRVEGVRSIGLDLVSRSYLLIDTGPLTVEVREAVA
jgi:predicted phosphodiesterase